jgi:hypothetical protein
MILPKLKSGYEQEESTVALWPYRAFLLPDACSQFVHEKLTIYFYS